jgi:hypothetical protein
MSGRIAGRRWVVVLMGVAMLAAAGAAVAYFTSSGSGTGSATVGSASSFTVTPQSATGSPLYPGAGTTNIAYTVTNSGGGSQRLNSVTAAVASSGANVTQAGVAKAGCLAADFTATVHQPTSPAPPATLAAAASATGGSVDVTMQDSGQNQDACQGVKPDITISAS